MQEGERMTPNPDGEDPDLSDTDEWEPDELVSNECPEVPTE